MKDKFVFLILHYLTVEDTKRCVSSIKEKCKEKYNYEILIIDNGSPNASGEIIKKKYRDDENITVILSEKNLGFAKGNNLGFAYAKKNMNPTYIIMINNDIIMLQEDFLDKIVEEYHQSQFAVLGPQIILNGKEFNYPDTLPTLKELKKVRRKAKRLYIFNKIYLRYVISLLIRVENVFSRKTKININIRKENVLLNGCCLIFSKEYIEKFDGIDDRTFLYYEEQLLYIRLVKNNLKSVYNPELRILHNEGVATNQVKKKKRDKFDFKLKHELDSLSVLIKEMENGG